MFYLFIWSINIFKIFDFTVHFANRRLSLRTCWLSYGPNAENLRKITVFKKRYLSATHLCLFLQFLSHKAIELFKCNKIGNFSSFGSIKAMNCNSIESYAV